MRRSILLGLIAALALATVFGTTTAVASGGDAGATASKKGKKKGCKGKGKGKGKGKKSAVASKKKGKGKGCKGKGGKADPKPAPGPPTGPPPATWPPGDGTYEDPQNPVILTLSGGGTSAQVSFFGPTTCFPISVGSNPGPVTATATSISANGTVGSSASVKGKWSITVQSDLSYQLMTDSSLEFPETEPCSKPGVPFSGRLVKAG